MSVFKNFIGVLAFAAIVTASAQAAGKYGMAGCGVGSMVFEDKPGKIQILAATTNDYFGQTFSITSGTSNCVDMGAKEEASLYITVNEEALAKDISRGNGSTLASLSKLLRCSDEAALGATLQSNYRKLFPVERKASLSDSIESTIKSDSDLSRNCILFTT